MPSAFKSLLPALFLWFLPFPVNSILAATPNSPTNGGASLSGDQLAITWNDNSDNEDLFVVYTYPDFSLLGTLAANSTSALISNLTPGSTVQFAIFAYNSDGLSSGYALTPAVRIPDRITRYGHQATVGEPFSAEIYTDGSASQSSVNLTGLPGWANFSESTRTVSGTPDAEGIHSLVLSVNYADNFSLSATIPLRVLPAPSGPVLTTELPTPDYYPGAGVQALDLKTHFTDPDCARAVRIIFNIGTMDIMLYENATPATVSNFLAYVNGTGQAAYDGSIIHRSVPSFIIQGGGYRPIGGSAFESVTDFGPVANEPGLENVRGTVSMAKIGGDPDSATSEWFVNLGDNRPNLDFQNGGFTVFGRIAGNGMDVADAIATLPIGNYSAITVDGILRTSLMTACPMNAASAPSSMEQDKLVTLNSAIEIYPLSFSIVSNSNTSVATAQLTNATLRITPLSAGRSRLRIRATDLDSNSLERDIDIKVGWTYARWAQALGLQTGEDGKLDDPDGDSLPNIIEYKLMGNPTNPTPSLLNVQTVREGAPTTQDFLAITFSTRNGTEDSTLYAETTGQLAQNPSWTEIWNSTLDISVPQVHAVEVKPSHTDWIIRDNHPMQSGTNRFMRVSITTN